MVNWRKFWRRWGISLSYREPSSLPSYAWSYLDHLAAVYATLNTPDPRAEALIKKAKDEVDDLTWGDIFLFENIVFSLQPDEVIERNAWIIRERFREISCASVYEKYVESHIPTETDTPAKLSLLKADLTRILDVLHWYYSLIPDRERIRKSLTKYCMWMMVIYTAILWGIFVWCHHYGMNFLAMAVSVIYWGIIGGFVSSQRRMQSIPSDGDPLISVFGLDNADYYLWLSPLLGAVFAVILALMFVAGILKGSVFPDFYVRPPGPEGLTFFTFTWETLPKTAEDYGKLFVWAFLAGFAERLVPDSLDRLSEKLAPDQKKEQPAVPPIPSTKDKQTPPPPPKLDHQEAKDQGISPEAITDLLHTGQHPPAQEDKKDAG